MFNKNIFTQKDSIADLVAPILEAQAKAKMEELKGQQHKIDKNKNNKIDADDFKILRGEKKAVKEDSEQVDEVNNPFDVKNYKSQLKSKPGEKAGFDSKKTSTGTMYSRKPAKPEKEDMKEEIDPKDTTVDTLKGREKESDNPFLSKKVKMDVPGNVKEESDQCVAEEAEQIDELKKSTLASYAKKATDDVSYHSFSAGNRSPSDPERLKDDQKAMKRQAGVSKAVDRLAKEEVQVDERTLTPGETKEKERIVKGMKKSLAGFKQRYGERAKSVMYATATKAAKKD